MLFHKNHICNIFVPHVLSWCVSSEFLIQWMIFHKNHICDFCVPHELFWCVSSDNLIEWMIFHNNHICDFFVLHELSWCVSSDYYFTLEIICVLLHLKKNKFRLLYCNNWTSCVLELKWKLCHSNFRCLFCFNTTTIMRSSYNSCMLYVFDFIFIFSELYQCRYLIFINFEKIKIKFGFPKFLQKEENPRRDVVKFRHTHKKKSWTVSQGRK